ncbi:MAG: acetyl-CoA acetyltransferase [Myxococcota bacterium]
MADRHNPVLVGAAQLVQRDAEPAAALEPLVMLERVAREAAADAEVGERALREIDTLGIVDVIGWRPQNAPRLLAERLGARPAREYLTGVGGEMPLTLVNRVAQQIAAGEARVALVAGCNNVRTLRRARRDGVELNWTQGGAGEPIPVGESKAGSSEREMAYGLKRPTDVYPVLENALRVRRGLDLETHRERMGALFSRFSQTAASNPYAWFPRARSAEEITTPTARNRMIAFPYTKYLNAVMETDQAAAVLLVSTEAARALGIPEAKWIHWWGGASSEEAAWFTSERPELAASPALRRAAEGAFAQAGVSAGDLDRIDFYSCFPVAVEMACEMLEIDEADPRGLTVTGGLPYAGGPGNNYTLHSLAAMMEKLRAAPGAKGLVTGNGWYLTKHAATVLASAPQEPAPASRSAAHERPASGSPQAEAVAIVDEANGRGRVETYTVVFDREGAPARGIVLGRLEDGGRFLANTPDDRALLEALVAKEAVGRVGAVTHRDGANLFDPS